MRRRLAGDEPAELRGSYLAEPRSDRLYVDGSMVPVIGGQGEWLRARSGLLVPASSVPQPIDFCKRYLTDLEVLGIEVTDDELENCFARVSVYEVLSFVAHQFHRLDQPQSVRGQADRDFADAAFMGDAYLRVVQHLARGWLLLVPQTLLVMAKLAVLHCPETREDVEPSAKRRGLIMAMLGVAGRLGSGLGAAGAESDVAAPSHPLVAEMASNQLFNSTADALATIGRFNRVWRQLSRQGAEALAVNDLFHEATGLSLDDFVFLGLVGHALALSKGRLTSEAFGSFGFDVDVARRGLDLLSGDVRALRQEMEGDRGRFEWTFSAFTRFPLVKLPDAGYLVVSPRLLLHRVVGGLVYFDVEAHLKKTGRSVPQAQPSVGRFKECHNRWQERYAEEVLEAMAPGSPNGAQRVFSEEEMLQAWGSRGRTCDVLLDYGDTWVCVEITARRVAREAVGSMSTAAWKKELEFFVDEKAEQLAETVTKLRQRESELTGRPAPSFRRFQPVLVTTEDFPVNPLIVSEIRRRLEARGLLQGPDVQPLQIVTVEELQQVEALQERGKVSLAEALSGREQSTLRNAGLDQYLAAVRQLPLRRPERVSALGNELYDELTARLPRPRESQLEQEAS